jgi:type I restriction enzyme S subunit
MTDGQLSQEGMLRTARATAEKYKRSTVTNGDLVVALRGSPGLTLELPKELDGANLTQGTARIAILEDLIPREYVLRVMNSPWMAAQIARVAKGSTFKELSLAALRNLQIPVTTPDAVRLLVEHLAIVDDCKASVEREVRSYSEVRCKILSGVFR